ncbi:MAG: lipopolysaccharide biosynthesis protein [Pirellulales bacterium]|nr:lipopolysaccharide biosynthesis protein [Pirellulales bacterium]
MDANLPESIHAAPPPDSVGRLARAGAKWSMANLVVRQVLAFGTTAVIARLVSPKDFGLIAEVTTLTAFLALISDMGLSWATVQRPNLREREVNSLFWLGVLLGAAAWGLCVGFSPVLIWFYGRAELLGICAFQGAALFLNGMTIQPVALLKRRLRQKEYSTSQTVSMTLGGVVGIVMALGGWGYWALVGQALAAAFLLLCFTFYFSGCRPGLPRFGGEIHGLLRFGGYIGLCNIVAFFQIYLDFILIGRFCGAVELGYYSRAYFLRTLPALYASMALTDVMIAALAALAHDRPRFAAAYHKALGLVAFVGCFAGTLLGVTAAETVRIVFGAKWTAVVPLVVWLSFPAVALPIYQTSGWLFIASGKAREQFWITVALTPVVAICYVIGVLAGGSLGVAIAAACALTIPIPAVLLYCAHRAAGVDYGKTLKIIFPIFACCLAALAAALAAEYACRSLAWHWLAVFAIKLLAGSAAYFLTASFIAKPILHALLARFLHRKMTPLEETAA